MKLFGEPEETEKEVKFIFLGFFTRTDSPFYYVSNSTLRQKYAKSTDFILYLENRIIASRTGIINFEGFTLVFKSFF
jgi:hypothetical protein